MTGRYEPVLHALSIEPRSARPGETIRVEFRARNLGALPSPAATVVFALPAGLEALAPTEVAVEPAAPGAHVVATLLARVGPPLDDRSELAVQAALRLPGAELGTNVCALEVRSRPVLDGPASGTFVAALGGDVVRVRAVVVNEGDGPARGVRLVVPAPLGCVRCDGDGPATLRCERLEAGESATLEFEARIVAPLDEIRADDGVVWIGDRAHCVLPVREGFVPEPVVAPPSVEVRLARRRVDLSVGVRNDGWAEARDLPVRLTLPAGLKMLDGSVAVDGVPATSRAAPRRGSAAPFARLVRADQTCTIVLAALPARSGVRIAMTATHPAGWRGGALAVTAGPHEETVSCVTEPARDVRASLAGLPRSVAPGEVVRFLARIANAGDVPETLRLATTGTSHDACSDAPIQTRTVTRMLAPGFVVSVPMTVHVADVVTDDELRLGVVVSDADGERATAQQLIAVRRRVSIAQEEPIALPPPRPHGAAVCGSLAVPSEVIAGAPFGLRVEMHVDEDIDALIIRVPAVAGVTYVAGSTSLDGCALLDRCGRSPLDEGLVLRAVRAGTRITAAWSCVADAVASEEPLSVGADAEADGTMQTLPAAQIHVRPSDSFAMRPSGLRYHVEACTATASVPDAPASPVVPEAATTETDETVADSPVSGARSPMSGVGGDAFGIARHDVLEISPARFGADAGATDDLAPTSRPRDDAFSFTLRLDSDRVERIERLVHDARSGGLVAHVLAVGALFPDSITRLARDGIAGSESDGLASFAGVQLALDDVRRALEDGCDRLFVKLRIPGFYVAADDLEDPALRRALTDLFERLREALDQSSPAARNGVIDSARAAETCALLVQAPYGAPAVLRALVALIAGARAANERADSADDPSFAVALERWVQRLDAVLARYEGVPLELFDDALANGSDAALDDARDALVRALRADLTPRQLAC
jgi:hypothetical protein